MKNIEVLIAPKKPELGKISIKIFETMEEALQNLGKTQCLATINDANTAAQKRAAYLAKTRKPSKYRDAKALADAAEKDPAVKAEIDALLKKHRIGMKS